MHVSLGRPLGSAAAAFAVRGGVVAALAAALLVAAPSAGATVVLPPGQITVPSSGTFLYMNSEPGDYIGGGIEQLYTSADSSFSASLPEGGSHFSAAVIQGAYTHWWYVDLAAPDGQPLQVGSYTDAERYPFQSPGHPGLSIDGDGRGCNTDFGQFDVNDIQYAPSGELLVFDATFEQHCESPTAPALYGRIRIENPPPPPDTTPPSLSLPGDMSVEAPDASGTNVYYSVYASDDRDPNPTVSCSPASGSLFAVGDTTVSCTATDASGNQSSGSFTVHVLPLLQMGLAINGSGSVSAKTGMASISGTISCSRPIGIYVSGTLSQVVANRATISGSFSTYVNCSAPSVSWSASVSGSNGKFAAGKASVSVDAYGCELSCHSASATAAVRLSASK
jgi:HYR domain-containing protein